jgi:hypothetical protein
VPGLQYGATMPYYHQCFMVGFVALKTVLVTLIIHINVSLGCERWSHSKSNEKFTAWNWQPFEDAYPRVIFRHSPSSRHS